MGNFIVNFNFNLPTRIVFGRGSSNQVGDFVTELGIKKVLILTDKGIRNAGLLEGIFERLSSRQIEYVLFDEIMPNPRDKDCDRASEFARKNNVEGLIAVGGGSVMDTAKAVGVVLTHGGSINDWEGDFTLQKEITPLICIPTTSGTGSEVTYISVITDTVRKMKMGIVDPKISATIAILDPELTIGLPTSITASTGMDALTHAIEAYTSRPASPLTDALALHAIKLIMGNLEEVVKNGDNIEAREKMMVASLMAGIAFGNSNVGSVHCLSEAIGGLYDTPHGVANSIFLPYVFEHNIVANIERHAEISYLLGAERSLDFQEAAIKGVQILFELSEKIGIPKFKDLPNVNPDDFLDLAKKSKNNIAMDPDNAREMTVDDYLMILNKAYRNEKLQSVTKSIQVFKI